MKTIKLKVKDRIGYIEINKPKTNSYDIGFLQLLDEKIDEATKNYDVKVIALKSKLKHFFCAGADVYQVKKNTNKENKLLVSKANKVSHKLASNPKITVALMNGHALGGGLELALACDIRLASDAEYLIGMPEVKLGLMPGNGGTQRLIRRINLSRALEFLLSGDLIKSDQAFDIGLVNQLYPEQEFEEQTKAYLIKLALGPIHAMSAIKQAVNQGIEMSLEEGLKLETTLADSLYDTEDAKEGLQAFIEKRKATFN